MPAPTTAEIIAARAQMVIDAAAHTIPVQSKTDLTKATAYAAYLNSLTSVPTVQVVTITTYSIRKL